MIWVLRSLIRSLVFRLVSDRLNARLTWLGERAGNAALEEIVMALNVRSDLMPQWTQIETTHLARASKLVSNVTAFPVQYNKAIVGKNAFAHESGIHQDGMLKNNQTYEIMLPETVGINKSSLVMGKHSVAMPSAKKSRLWGIVFG